MNSRQYVSEGAGAPTLPGLLIGSGRGRQPSSQSAESGCEASLVLVRDMDTGWASRPDRRLYAHCPIAAVTESTAMTPANHAHEVSPAVTQVYRRTPGSA